MHNDELKKKLEEEGVPANADNGDLEGVPSTGAEENDGPSEIELPEDTDGIAEENITPDAPEAEGDR